MICLGIEGTAHTFGAAVVSEKGEILSDVRDNYSTEKGGIIPSEAARHHEKVYRDVIQKAIIESKVDPQKIKYVSFSSGPGLSPCLRVTLKAAKEISKELNAKLVPVNHCIAHLTIAQLVTKVKNPVYVYVSGANTQVISLEGKRFRIFGETLDIGLGNALDKFGREIGLGFPCGPKIEELAKYGSYIELPYIVKGMDLSYSGIVTKLINLSNKNVKKENLCYSFQETAFAMLTEVAERALAHCNKKEIALIGGVAANKRLCEMMDIMCKERGAEFFPVPLKYCGDQAVMIAWQGILEKDKIFKKIDINPNWRTDQVDVNWK